MCCIHSKSIRMQPGNLNMQDLLTLTNLPLNLAWLINLNEANLEPQLHKLISSKCLRQDVCKLHGNIDVFDVHRAFFNAFSDEVVSCVDMFTAIVKDGVLTE
ncbi:hypothetical protein GUJ93_ZPchr0009g501 [Zizania palustris]|uniref:Uncharacterized protein n=1 Tax=Zizania palustris TaxID=103762 RepID=A0A8J5VLA2_ZIZPA|nr:hypothetical protein GUJ93_ZPchr0009g501 [Zizania palustris]